MRGGGSSEGPGGEAGVSSGSPARARRVGEVAAERRLGWGWQQASLLCAEPRVLRVHNGAADSGPAARPGRRRAALAMEDAPGLCSCEAPPAGVSLPSFVIKRNGGDDDDDDDDNGCLCQSRHKRAFWKPGTLLIMHFLFLIISERFGRQLCK